MRTIPNGYAKCFSVEETWTHSRDKSLVSPRRALKRQPVTAVSRTNANNLRLSG